VNLSEVKIFQTVFKLFGKGFEKKNKRKRKISPSYPFGPSGPTLPLPDPHSEAQPFFCSLGPALMPPGHDPTQLGPPTRPSLPS